MNNPTSCNSIIHEQKLCDVSKSVLLPTQCKTVRAKINWIAMYTAMCKLQKFNWIVRPTRFASTRHLPTCGWFRRADCFDMKLSRNQGHAKAVGVSRIVTDHFVHFLRMHMTRRTTIKLELYIVVGREEMAFCQFKCHFWVDTCLELVV